MDKNLSTILVCDDQPENIDVLRGILKKKYKVLVCTSGQRALEIAAHLPSPDLILLDISMPGMDGYETCTRLKQNYLTRNIPVIFVTALNSPQDEARGLTVGGVDYITKPVNAPVVEARVAMHLSLRNQQKHLEELVQERTKELEETRAQIIRRLGRAAEYKDDETGNHVLRMSHYARLLAQKIGLSPEVVELIFQAAPMHDVGKIGIPDAVLRKPGKLNEEEWAVMRQHPAIGAGIIGKHNSPLLQTAFDVAISHHEKWDGSGYPKGLSGENIPIAGRIVALADVFDALTSERPYKKAWTLTEAMNFIREQSGKHFDPNLAEAFLEIIPNIIEIKDRYSVESEERTLQF